MLKSLNNRVLALGAMVAAFFAVSAPAHAAATGPDFSTLTDAISFDSTQAAIQSVGALAIGLAVVVLGLRKIMQMVRGA